MGVIQFNNNERDILGNIFHDVKLPLFVYADTEDEWFSKIWACLLEIVALVIDLSSKR